MKTALAILTLALGFIQTGLAADTWVTYEGKDGPGKGKRVVFLTGDEEYRSEEGLPMLAKILSQRHGCTCTVLFSTNAAGEIDPNAGGSISGTEALDSADAIVMLLRFRHWPDADMERFEKAYLAGKPIIALRTSTHAFNFGNDSKWVKWTWNNKEGGFGKMVLGETWVSHWGNHGKEATRGVIEPSAKDNPILRGVTDVFGDTDVYEAAPPADAKLLLRGMVLKGMKPEDPPADPRTKDIAKGEKQGINDPMMPLAWTREHTNQAGKTNRVFCTTMGAATDLQNEGLRRLVVNAVFWGMGMEVPAKANVDYVGEYKPTRFGFDRAKKGVRPADHKL